MPYNLSNKFRSKYPENISIYIYCLLLRKVSKTNYVNIDIVIYTIYFDYSTAIYRFVLGVLTRNYHFHMISCCVHDSSFNWICVVPTITDGENSAMEKIVQLVLRLIQLLKIFHFFCVIRYC